jgi:chromosome segregation ATPase
MKRILPLTLLSSVLLVSGFGLTGCQSMRNRSAAMTRGERATATIHSAADNVQTAQRQIDTSLAALRDLTDRPVDTKNQYRQARAEIAALRDSSDRISDNADDLRQRGDAYLSDWARQIAVIESPDLRNAAFERRDEVAAKLRDISDRFQRVQAEFMPFRRNLDEINAALGADLSQRGLETVRPFIARATENAGPVRSSLEQLVEEFREVGLSLQPVNPQTVQLTQPESTRPRRQEQTVVGGVED